MAIHTNKDPKKQKEEGKDKYKTYTNDDTVNEDMKAGNPTGIAENEEDHASDTSGQKKKPRLP